MILIGKNQSTQWKISRSVNLHPTNPTQICQGSNSRLRRERPGTNQPPRWLFVCFWRGSPQWTKASSFTRYLGQTQRRATVGRTLLDEWSARRRGLYLTSHNTRNRQTSMSPGGIRTHNLVKRAAADPRLTPRGHRDRLTTCLTQTNSTIQIYNFFPYLPENTISLYRKPKKLFLCRGKNCGLFWHTSDTMSRRTSCMQLLTQ